MTSVLVQFIKQPLTLSVIISFNNSMLEQVLFCFDF